jgi:hypothetical protein
VKNLRAAAEVAKDLSNLSSEALREQQAQLNHLLSEATKQQEAFKKANPGQTLPKGHLPDFVRRWESGWTLRRSLTLVPMAK